MPHPLRLAVLAAALSCLAGCAGPPMSDLPIPVVNDGPNPSPVPGYRVVCQSTPGFPGTYTTGCRQELGPAVVRTRG